MLIRIWGDVTRGIIPSFCQHIRFISPVFGRNTMLSSSEFFHSKLYNERCENLKCHTILFICIIGAFAILRKVTINSSCLSLCLSPCLWNNSVPTGRIIMKFHIWVFFENLSRNLSLIKIWQEQQRAPYTVHCTLRPTYLAQFFLESESF